MEELKSYFGIYMRKINQEISEFYFFKKEYELKENILNSIQRKFDQKNEEIENEKMFK